MKNISNEVKVGAIAIITIVVFIWLYNFLKGKNLLNKDTTYYAVYEKVGGLGDSSPVEVNGYRVGVVKSISFIDAESGRLIVEFSIDKDFKLPVNTVAEIVPVSVLGGMKVQFVFGEGPGFYNEMDTIPGRLEQSITEMLETELVPVKDQISSLITGLDSVVVSLNDVMNTSFKRDLGNTMTNLSNTSGIFSSKSKELKTTIDNLTNFSNMLSENSGKLSQSMGNLQNLTDTLVNADIAGTITNLRSTLGKTTQMLEKLNNGEGSAGQLLTNDSLYNNLSQSLESLDILLLDLKQNPGRYVHFSLFGRKDKMNDK
jgi:phospholipid/cholesterol/gamma-HCH transport system substrate-binding protein